MPNRTKPAKRTKSKGCERCNFTGQLPPLVAKKKPRPCPYCNRGLKLDTSGLKSVMEGEKLRRRDLIERVELVVMRDQPAEAEPPLELLTTDRVLQRWATGHGSGLPFSDEELDELVEAAQQQEDVYSQAPAKPPTLDDATQTVVDQIIGPNPWVRIRPGDRWTTQLSNVAAVRKRLGAVDQDVAEFTWDWYCRPTPCTVMSLDRGMDEIALYLHWHGVLRILRDRFVACRHRDLVNLVVMPM